MAPFFILYYGIMMADMGYGLLMMIASVIIGKKYRPKGTSGELFSLLGLCGLSTFIVGALTGGFFGDFLTQLVAIVSPGTVFTLPKLFDPLDDLTMILIGSMALAARQEVLGETYVRALELLCSMPREDYLALLIKLLRAAGGKGDEAIALSAKDRDAIGQALVERANRELNAHYTLAASAADIRAGLVLVSPECDVNCSFETLLALSRERTERGAAKLLFAE